MQCCGVDDEGFKLFAGLIFSLNVLYLVTCVFVMFWPEDVNAVDDVETDTHRMESAVIVNSLVLAVLGLFLFARGFSSLGESMVGLLYELIESADSSNFSHSNFRSQRNNRTGEPSLGFEREPFKNKNHWEKPTLHLSHI